jgi:glycosyltransferase involved in cell wall biosynthesis
MKVLIYSDVFLPISGGVQTIVRELARGLAAWKPKEGGDSIEVTVVTRTCQRMQDDDEQPYRLVRCPSYPRLLQLIRDADIVHLAGPAFLPLALGLLARKKVVIEHHGYQSMCPNGLLLYGPDHSVCPGYFMKEQYNMCVRCNAGRIGLRKSIRDLLLTFPRRWMCQMAARNIAVTGHVSNRIALPRTTVVYHGIAESSQPASNEGAERAGEPLNIGYVGRLVTEKGLPVLLDAAKRLDDAGLKFHLTFVGDGPERGNLESSARLLGFRNPVKFLGELHGDELDSAVRSLQVVVTPSQCEETAGLAAIEHMFRGGAVVVSDIGGLGEVVADAGLKFTPGNSEDLYESLRQLIESPSLRTSLGLAARARAVQSFGRDSMINGHVAVYRSLMPENSF